MKNMQQVERIGNTHDTRAITVLVFIIENELAAHQNRRGEWARATICGILSTPKMWSGLAFIVRKKQYFDTKNYGKRKRETKKHDAKYYATLSGHAGREGAPRTGTEIYDILTLSATIHKTKFVSNWDRSIVSPNRSR